MQVLAVRCSFLGVFCRKDILKHFATFTEKNVPKSLFNKVGGLQPATLLKKRLWNMRFPVNFAKFLKIIPLKNTSRRLHYI